MKASPIGAIMHDGWSKVSTHYFGLYACYNIKIGDESRPTSALLAVSPLSKVLEADEPEPDDVEETSTFDARAHADFIRSVFHDYYTGVDFDTWCVAQVGDNAATNKATARLLNVKFIGCKSHQLALDVKLMLEDDASALGVIDSVHETMSSIKSSIVNFMPF